MRRYVRFCKVFENLLQKRGEVSKKLLGFV